VSDHPAAVLPGFVKLSCAFAVHQAQLGLTDATFNPEPQGDLESILKINLAEPLKTKSYI
jgi:hypothetical protein